MFTWPYLPDWSRPVTQTLSYRTRVLESRGGKQQRIASRAEPRLSWEFSHVAARREAFIRVQRDLFANLRHEIVMPFPVNTLKLRRTFESDTAAIMTDGGVSGFISRAGLIVLTNGVIAESRTVAQVFFPGAPNDFSVYIPGDWSTLAPQWPAGTYVFPAAMGRLRPSIRQRGHTDLVSEVAVAFDVTPGSMPVHDAGNAGNFV